VVTVPAEEDTQEAQPMP
jgi:hypothetical protein